MIEINTICELLLEALQDVGYKESTVFNYQGAVRRFKAFCSEKNVTVYTTEFGKLYADDVISPETGQFSTERYHLQGRFIRLMNSYYSTGQFDFSIVKRGKVAPTNPLHKDVYDGYQKVLHMQYTNENTIHFYEYEFYYFLQFLHSAGIDDIATITPETLFSYIRRSKTNRQRAVLCGLRSSMKYLRRDDLIASILGIHSPRTRRIIPTLTDDENQRLNTAIESSEVTLRDAAIVLLGMSSGIRACDLIKLKMSDIDWISETISFYQSKTGNFVCLPLIPSVGNAIFRYIHEERPAANNEFLFVRELAPFDPFTDHSSCYEVVRRVFCQAGIDKGNRILGMCLLRHNAASTMVKNAVPIETIAAVLGHANPDTTDIYITTDEYRLRECVLPMTGISKEVNP
jgi:integrase